MRQRLSDDQWAHIIDRFEQSDLTQRQFAELHALNLHTFRSRLYRIRQSPHRSLQRTPFVELQVSPQPPATHALDLRLGDLELRFSELPDFRWIAGLLHCNAERR